MSDKIDLFEKVLENLFNRDKTEATYTLRALADDIEDTGFPNAAEMKQALVRFLDEREEDDYADPDNESYDTVDESGSLFDSYGDDD